MSQVRIPLYKITDSLNKEELKSFCESYNMNTSNFNSARSLNMYRRNLLTKIWKERSEESDIDLSTFINKFIPRLSHESIIKIYPEYDNYIKQRKKKHEKELKNKREKDIMKKDFDKWTEQANKQRKQRAEQRKKKQEELKEHEKELKKKQEDRLKKKVVKKTF